MLIINNLSFCYEDQIVVKNLSLDVKKGEITTILGPSGCGKTTLFRLISGLLPSEPGKITVAGQSYPISSQSISFMMQEDLLIPWRTVLDNILLLKELGPEKNGKECSIKKALHLLKEVNLEGCENLFPRELSGGMRQRVALARSLLQNRPLLLLDEPFGALDFRTRETMYQLLIEIQKRYNKTILLITHDFNDALALSNNIHVLSDAHLSKAWKIPPNTSFEDKVRIQISLREILV
jgi:NitT/TauT family transport system ATP-binding protein